jgi:hypothetical protein
VSKYSTVNRTLLKIRNICILQIILHGLSGIWHQQIKFEVGIETTFSCIRINPRYITSFGNDKKVWFEETTLLKPLANEKIL